MNRIAGMAILAVGVVLLVMGISASESVGSDLSRLFTGAPTDKSIWLMLGGVAAIAIGSGSLFFTRAHPGRS